MSSIEFHSNVDEVLSKKDEAIAKALEAIGQQAENYAKDLAPVDTGRLKNSIMHTQEDEDTEIIATATSYAPYQEYGTRRTKAHPFMRPAVQDHINEYKRIAEEYLKDA